MHVERLAARRQLDRLTHWCALLITCWVIGLMGGVASRAQDFTPPISNGKFYANSTSGNAAAAPLTLSITPSANDWAYLCHWSVYSNGATAAATVNVTVGSLLTVAGTPVTLTYPFANPTAIAAGTPDATISDTYWPCARGTAPGAAITVTVPTIGTGNTVAIINLTGLTGQ